MWRAAPTTVPGLDLSPKLWNAVSSPCFHQHQRDFIQWPRLRGEGLWALFAFSLISHRKYYKPLSDRLIPHSHEAEGILCQPEICNVLFKANQKTAWTCRPVTLLGNSLARWQQQALYCDSLAAIAEPCRQIFPGTAAPTVPATSQENYTVP